MRIETLKRAIDDALALGRLCDQVETGSNGSETVLDLIRVDSPAEHGDDLYLAAMQRYVADLGGRLVVEAVFPGLRVNLLRSSDAPPSSLAADATDRVPAPARTSS